MRILILFCLVLMQELAWAQDTTQFVRHYDGTKSFWLITKTDTALISVYPNGVKESERKLKNNAITGTYKRWYDNGEIMWEKEIVKGISEGKTIFYDQKGNKVAELLYESGSLKDTIYIKENIHLVLGTVTSESVVHGGMQRADGSSNISRSSGPWQYYPMYAAKVDSIKKPELVQKFRSDHNGEFFVLAPEGKIGFFPQDIDIEKLNPGEYYPPPRASMSVHSGWNMTKPLSVRKEDKVLSVFLRHFSEGFAP